MMASSVAPWTSIRRRVGVDDATASYLNDSPSHNSERCRALLLRLLREVLAFVRQHQQRTQINQRDAMSTLWMNAVGCVCEARLEQLQGSTSELLPVAERVRRTMLSPREVIAEAMVQELLASVAAIRLAETETAVLDEVENVETLRRLRVTLKQDEAELRRVVKEGAGEDTRLLELQRLLRDEFLQELAQSKAQGLADSLHNEASLQFAWETIQEQKKEIVRLRAENEQLQSETRPVSDGRQSDRYEDAPRHAIHQLQLQLSSHPNHNLRILQEQVAQLEATLGQHDRQTSRDPATSLSGITMTSSRDDDDVRQDSILLPSHLVTVVPRECEQCRRHARTLVECQSELKQRRAQCAADENALVQAEKDHLHMKREHVALTSALVASKQQQEELRKMVLDISNDKLALETLRETQQRNHDHQVDQLQRQLKELENWRERNGQEKRDHRNVQDALEGELQRVRLRAESLQTEREAARVEITKLKREIQDLNDNWTVDKAKAVEAESALASADGELQSVKKELKAALDHVKKVEATTSRLRLARDQALAASDVSSSEQLELQRHVKRVRAETNRLEAALARSESRVSQLELQVSKRDASMMLCNRHIQEERSSREAVDQKLQEARTTIKQLQQFVAELEGRVDRSEEERSVLANRLDEVLRESKDIEKHDEEMKSELQRQYEECQRLEIQLADSQADATKYQSQLHEANAAVQRLQVSVDHHKQDQEGVLTSTREQTETLTHELSETKTTILMWMSKYHGVVNAKSQLEEAVKAADLATNELRESYRVLAEDKEALLVNVDKMMAEARSHKDKHQSAMKEITRLKAQVVVYEADLAQLREANARATEKMRARECDVADQLVEIGVLQADKSILTRELEHLKQQFRDAERERQAQEAVHVDEVAGLKRRHEETVTTARLDVKKLFTANGRVVESTLQRVAQQLSMFDKRLVRAAELTTRVQTAAPTSSTSLEKALQCASCRQERSPASEPVQSTTNCIKMSAASTQTMLSSFESGEYSFDPSTDFGTTSADDHRVSLYAESINHIKENGVRCQSSFAGPRGNSSGVHVPSSRQNGDAPETNSNEATAQAFNDSFSSEGDDDVLVRSQGQLYEHSNGGYDTPRDEMSPVEATARTVTAAGHPTGSSHQSSSQHSLEWNETNAMAPSTQLHRGNKGKMRASLESKKRNSRIKPSEEEEVEKSAVMTARSLHGPLGDPSQRGASEEDRKFVAQGEQLTDMPFRRPDTFEESQRQQVLDLIVVQFVASQNIVTAQWRLVEDLVVKTASRLDNVSDRAVVSVSRWKCRQQQVRRSQCVVSVGCQASFGRGNASQSIQGSAVTECVVDPAEDGDEGDVEVEIRGVGLSNFPATARQVVCVERTPTPSMTPRLSASSNERRLQVSMTKAPSIRRASVTHSQPKSTSQLVMKFTHVTRIRPTVVSLQGTTKTRMADKAIETSTSSVAVDASAQTANGDVESRCVRRRQTNKWVELASHLLRRSTWRGVVAALKLHQQHLRHRLDVTERFTRLTLRMLAKHRTRDLLSIVSSQIESIQTANTRCVEESRENRRVTRWESMVRSVLWRFSARRPLKLVVATLTKRVAKRQGHAHCQWQLFRWKLDSQRHEWTGKHIWLKYVALHRRMELARRLRRHFVAWRGLVRGFIHHPSLSDSDHEDHEVKSLDMTLRRPANVSTSLQLVMRECVTLLRQWCQERKVLSDESRSVFPSEMPSRSQSMACSSAAEAQSTGSSASITNIELLIRLLLQSSEQISQWREALDKKLEEIRIREAQLSRLQNHCTELQAIIDKYHERPRQHQRISSDRNVHDEVSVSVSTLHHHKVHTTHAAQQHSVHLRALEEERRRLNQRNIAMLEGVIVQLNEAKESRVRLHQQLRGKTKQLERAQRQLEQAHIHNMLLLAFYQWRHRASQRQVDCSNQLSP